LKNKLAQVVGPIVYLTFKQKRVIFKLV